jgi:uncharacterized protein
MRVALRLIPLVFILVIASTVPVSAQDVPSIYLYVNDFAGVLTQDEISTLDDICYELDLYNSDELAVVVVNTTQPMGIDTYSFRVFDENGIGKESKDNGVLILISTDERLWRIEVGYGLEGILNDAKVGSLGRENLEPYLAAEDYYSGIFYTVGAIVDQITAEPSNGGRGFEIFPGITINWWHLALAVIVMFVIGIITRGRAFFWIGSVLTRGRFGGGRSGGGGAKGRF